MTRRITTANVSIEVSLKRRIPFQSASWPKNPSSCRNEKIQKNNPVPCLLLILSLYSIQNYYSLQTRPLQGVESSCSLLKNDFGKNYCPCPLLKKQLPQKCSSCLLLKKQIKNKYFSCLLFLTTTFCRKPHLKKQEFCRRQHNNSWENCRKHYQKTQEFCCGAVDN